MEQHLLIDCMILSCGCCVCSGELPAWDADGKVDRWTDLGLDLWAKDA